MIPVLVSSSSLEAVISDVFTEQQGHCFQASVSNMVTRLCNSYNSTQGEQLIDAAIKGIEDVLTDYSPIDMIVDIFIRLVEGYVDMDTCIPQLEYEVLRETIVISSRLKPKVPVINTLIEEYRHAESRGDYLPEKYRRAFEGLL